MSLPSPWRLIAREPKGEPHPGESCSTRGMFRALLVATALVLAVVLGVAPIAPMTPVPASAPATEFSAERAMSTLAVIAAKPHPTGTAADDEVREYLGRELEALGFEVDVQDATALTEVYAKRWGIPVVAAH